MMKQLYQDKVLIELFENAYDGADNKLIHAAAKDIADTMAEKARILYGPAWSLLAPKPIKQGMESKKYTLADLLGHPEKEIGRWPGVVAQNFDELASFLALHGLGRLWPPAPYSDKAEAGQVLEVALLDTLATKLCLLTGKAFARAFEAKGVAYMAALGAIKAIWDKTVVFYGDPRKLGVPDTLAAFMRKENIHNIQDLLDQNELRLYALGLKPDDMRAVYAILDGKGLMAFVR